MANQLERIKLTLRSPVVLLLPLGLWALLWLGLQPGSIQNVFDPGSPTQFLHGLRAAFPFAAASVAVVIMLVKLSQRDTWGLFFFSPLGLVAVYGLVGVGAALLSPQSTVAIYWVALYLTVPLILWATVWGADSLGPIRRLIHFNWLIIVLAFAALFVLGLLFLDLGESLLKPSNLLRCQGGGSWYNLTSGVVRSTGVGRYAAVTGIIAIPLLWRGNWRVLWGLVLLASVALLLTTGARTSIVGFAAAAPVVALLLGGRKAIIGGAVALAILVPLAWTTGAHETFLRNCISRGWDPSGLDFLKLRAPIPAVTLNVPAGGVILSRLAADGQIEPNVPVRLFVPTVSGSESGVAVTLNVPAGGVVLSRLATDGQNEPDVAARFLVPAGKWKLLLPLDNALANGIYQVTLPASTPTPSRGGSGQSAPDRVALPTLELVADAAAIVIPSGWWIVDQPPQSAPDASNSQAQVGAPTLESSQESISPDAQVALEAEAPGQLLQLEPILPTQDIDLGGQVVLNVPADGAKLEKIEKIESVVPDLGGESSSGLFTLTGRTKIWAAGWEFIKRSPALGYGFHADRLVLGTHMHNAVLHAMIQTGFIGTIPFVGAMLWAWFLLLKTLRKLRGLAAVHQILLIQTAGIMVFLSARAFPESTGAFFGVDWLLLGPLLLYLKIVNSSTGEAERAP